MPSSIPFQEPTKRPENVILAGPGHAQQVYDLLQKLYSENAIFLISPRKVQKRVVDLCNQQGGVVGLIMDSGQIAGCVGLEIDQYWYTETWCVGELWNFVHPDFRRTEYAKSLIEFSKWFNENMNLMLCMGIMSTGRTAAKVRLYRRQMVEVGSYFMNGIPSHSGLANQQNETTTRLLLPGGHAAEMMEELHG